MMFNKAFWVRDCLTNIVKNKGFTGSLHTLHTFLDWSERFLSLCLNVFPDHWGIEWDFDIPEDQVTAQHITC